MDPEDKEMIANFFDAGEAEAAQEALKIIGIESTSNAILLKPRTSTASMCRRRMQNVERQ